MKTFFVDTKADIVGHIHCGIIQDSIIKDSIPKYMVTPPKKKKSLRFNRLSKLFTTIEGKFLPLSSKFLIIYKVPSLLGDRFQSCRFDQ